jgi:hypothetical protein
MGNSAVGSQNLVQRIQTGRNSFHPHHFRYITTTFPLAVRRSHIYNRFIADCHHLPIRGYGRCIWNAWLNQPKIGQSSISPHDVTIKTMLLCILWNKKRYSYPYTGLDRPVGLWEVEASIISRQLAQEGGKVASHKHRPPLPPRRYPSCSFHTTEQLFHNYWPRPSGGPWGYSNGSANSHSFAASLAPQAYAWLLLLKFVMKNKCELI